MTGRKLIDSMNDAELADFLCNTCFCDLVCQDTDDRTPCKHGGHCAEQIALWLEQEMHK